MTLSAEQILAAEDLSFQEVEVPEWGGTVRIRELTGAQRDAFEGSVMGDGKKPDIANIRARLVAACLVDDAGKPLFNEAAARKLGEKSGRVLDRLFDTCRELNGLTEQAVEELAEGFGDAQSAD